MGFLQIFFCISVPNYPCIDLGVLTLRLTLAEPFPLPDGGSRAAVGTTTCTPGRSLSSSLLLLPLFLAFGVGYNLGAEQVPRRGCPRLPPELRDSLFNLLSLLYLLEGL